MVKNLLLFKVGWLACVIGAAQGIAWLGTATVALVVAEHLRKSMQPSREMVLLTAAGLVGLVWESTLVATGLIEYGSGLIAPYWIIAMWILFATTLNIGMQWVKKHWLVAAVAGAIGGPVAFAGGERLGAVTFTDPLSLFVIGLGWAILLPILAEVAQRFDGQFKAATAASQALS